jgi:spore coat protein A, manganese oxidase
MGSEPISEGGLSMKVTRREFIKTTAMAAGAVAGSGILLTPRGAQAYAASMPLQKFIQPMRLFGADIPLAKADTTKYGGVDYYNIVNGWFRDTLHPSLPPTRLYGYGASVSTSGELLQQDFGTGAPVPPRHLGHAVLANYGTPLRFTFTSALPASHILPYDTSIPNGGNGGDRKDRAAVHLHGGLVPWPSDGGPFHWQCPDPAVVGASVMPWLWDGTVDQVTGQPVTTNKVWDYFYPNLQSARLMWYHDHAIGETRLNAYAGAATGYILQDPLDNIGSGVGAGGGTLNTVFGIPFLGQPIVFQDKVFWSGPGPTSNDPNYANIVPGAQAGDLWYPYVYDPAIWPIAKGGVPPAISAIPEFFGDTMLANGVVYPFHNVGVGRYRFRLLNACNARFLDLSFVQENGTTGEPLLRSNGRPVPANVDVWQIGTEGGFLPTPVQLVTGGVLNQPFVLGPAERADIIVDFKAAGNVILYNVAGSPFPGGSPIFDWYLGSKKTPVATTAGNGPNTRTIMRFVVSGNSLNTITVPPTIPVASIPTAPDLLNGGLMVNPAYLNAAGNVYTDPFTGDQYAYDPVPVELTLNEVVEPIGFAGPNANTGRLLTLIGNRANPTLLPLGAGGTYYFEQPTESVQYKTLRIWKIYNFTADAHPMHFHLFNVQILGRQRVDKTFLPKAPALPPLPNELGFKETVVMYPGEATIVAALVEDPMPSNLYPKDVQGRPQVAVTVGANTVLCPVPPSPRLAAFGLTNHDEYVWHCHILEHEEHDMMRPLVAS